MNIFYCSDENYMPITLASVRSLVEHNPNANIFIIVPPDGVDEKWRGLLPKGTKIIQAPAGAISARAENAFRILPAAAYMRLLIPKLCPKINRAIYLDCDTIISADLTELFDFDLRGSALGAVYDQGTTDWMKKQNAAMRLNEFHPLINSGVLLMDCKKWRDENIAEKILALDSVVPDRLDNDQGLINKYFADKFLCELPVEYNFMLSSIIFHDWDRGADAAIVHYTGPHARPWLEETQNPKLAPYFDLWKKYSEGDGPRPRA
ncbi:MAG: glycosyltransferase family 8 protein [Rickettsiales bacterium]|jgi:lipopolysaccharide biosynthesis glycosyltransferase|nr:glycosyltransferase family 8 protein [Rickettsiales bacterium]